MQPTNHPFDRFADARTIRLTTWRRDGRPVPTPVSIAVDGDRAFVRTYDSAGKMKRIRRNPRVAIAPSTIRGKPIGPETTARAQVLEGEDADRAARLLARKHPVLHGLAVPLAHRLTGKRTVHLELLPEDAADQATFGTLPTATR